MATHSATSFVYNLLLLGIYSVFLFPGWIQNVMHCVINPVGINDIQI